MNVITNRKQKLSCGLRLTETFKRIMEERDYGSVHQAVKLVNKCLFDHLVSRNKNDPFIASPQTEHWSKLFGKLHSDKIYVKCYYVKYQHRESRQK